MTKMTPEEIRAFRPERPCARGQDPRALAQAKMERLGLWSPEQSYGRRWAMGCVALEITQRCNLDCTLCYLSETAEAVHDLPLEEVYRRIDQIRDTYGPNTDVQVTGGDPTLRQRDELIAIVQRCAERGLRPALFTNGIRATRDLLTDLAAVGLVDVAFHVDLTQQRKGYGTETALNEIRRQYIERARGLGLHIIFNTSVCADNFHEIPAVVDFFVRNADAVDLASFQLAADTGRGVDRSRPDPISQEGVAGAIRTGLNRDLSFGLPQVGHASCNAYGIALVADGQVFDLLDDKRRVIWFMDRTAHLSFARGAPGRALGTALRWILANPVALAHGLAWGGRKLREMARPLWRARGRVHKISFFIHNFMHAHALEHDRIEACSFMVATAEGAVPMCLHNARRDHFTLSLIERGEQQGGWWDPLSGTSVAEPTVQTERSVHVPPKRRKGRDAARTIPVSGDLS